jgi:hypothetical protein
MHGYIHDSIPYIDNSNGSNESLSPFLKYPQINMDDQKFSVVIKKDEAFLDNNHIQILEPLTVIERVEDSTATEVVLVNGNSTNSNSIASPVGSRDTTAIGSRNTLGAGRSVPANSTSTDIVPSNDIRGARDAIASSAPEIINAENTYFISMREEHFSLEIIEENVDDLKENFDIEIFLEQEITQTNNVVKKEWKQLNFPKKVVKIKNNILLDTPENLNAADLKLDGSFAENYLEILVDEELELTPKQLIKLNIYNSNATPPFGADC